jgi:hypothetical protein
MLLITTTPIAFKAKKIIRILHNFDNKNPMIELEAQQLQGSKTVIRVGQTYTDDATVYGNDAIVVHSCSEPLIKDYLRRLRPWETRMRNFMKDPNKFLVIYGNVMSIISDLVCIIPPQDNVIVNAMQRSASVDTTTRGLGLTKYWCITVTNMDRIGENLKRSISYISHTRPIYILTSNTVIDEKGKVNFGGLYRMKDGKLEQLKELVKPHTDKDIQTVNERNITPDDPTATEKQAITTDNVVE